MKILKIVLALLITATLIIGIILAVKYVKIYSNEVKVKNVISEIINKEYENAEEIDVQIDGYKVIGIIKIPKINLEYPILETSNTDTLKLSIVKFWGPDLNQKGNVVLAGHNYANGVFFGDLKMLEQGDVIEITDKHRNTIKYEVDKTYVVDTNDVSIVLPEKSGKKELTLYTCTNGKANRLVVRAIEILD